jgi:peptidoglycan/LPS O-acetylase OafA/YrhL
VRLGSGTVQQAIVGHHEIPALDGIRALAALSVLFYHSFQLWRYPKVVLDHDITIPWNYTQTGVHLFFVLSGFLLFLPYARTMLEDRPLPGARRFYQRRALRILPTYWVCMVVLVLAQWPAFASPTGLANVATHTVLLHDDFQQFNRAIEGPFWTLAIEAQFYVLLPLLAVGIAGIVGRTRSARRLILGVLAILLAVFALRGLGALAEHAATQMAGGAAAVPLHVVALAIMGTQGKFLEVFALGMLASALYLVMVEQRRLRPSTTRWLGLGLLGAALALAVALAPAINQRNIAVPAYELVAQPGNWSAFFGPFLTGMSYACFLLAVLWIGGGFSGLFASLPLRLVGVMSYSLYLWHLPIVHGMLPLTPALSLAERVSAALAVAGVSYWLLERPFLRRKARLGAPQALGVSGSVAQALQTARRVTSLAKWRVVLAMGSVFGQSRQQGAVTEQESHAD